jgi:hypothetical protein
MLIMFFFFAAYDFCNYPPPVQASVESSRAALVQHTVESLFNGQPRGLPADGVCTNLAQETGLSLGHPIARSSHRFHETCDSLEGCSEWEVSVPVAAQTEFTI